MELTFTIIVQCGRRLERQPMAETHRATMGGLIPAHPDPLDNGVSGQLVGRDWSDTGIYGVTDAHSISLSWRKSDEGRLRCFDVVVVDGMVETFKPDGSFAGDVVSVEDGDVF